MNLIDLPSREIMPGFHGKLIHTQHMSLVFWEVDKEAYLPLHSHSNEQVVHVVEGKFELTLDGTTSVHEKGAIVVIPPHVPHEGRALTSCKLIDIFSPVREDFK